MLISLHNKLTHLNGVINPEAVDRLEDMLGRRFTVAKMHHYKQGQKYGNLASAIPKPKYRVIWNTMWTHTIPDNPGMYTAALAIGNKAALPKKYVVKPKIPLKRRATMTTLASRRHQGGVQGTHPVCSGQ